jgi:predicted RNA binding protein YcfA (HicA-like mRNA interferase family)
MKCSELLRRLKKDGWIVISSKGSHLKMKHPTKEGIIIFPDHGSREIGKGLEKRIITDAGLKGDRYGNK